MFKRAKVVMLPTNEKANVYLNEYADNKNKADKLVFGGKIKNELTQSIKDLENRGYKAQHLYTISDDKIKKGEELKKGAWYINTYRGYSKPFLNHNLDNNGYLKEVIATTDSSLKIKSGKDLIKEYITIEENLNGIPLPQPSQSFIEKYIEQYNRDNVVTDVLVEYITTNSEVFYSNDIPYSSVKVNPKDNTITIKKVKDVWNKSELESLLFDFAEYITEQPKKYVENTEKWIKDHH